VHRVTPQPSMSNSPEPSIHGSRLDLSEGFVAGDTAANLEEAVRILSPPRPPGRLARLRPSALTAEALFSPSGGPVDVEHGSPRPDVERASPRPAIVDDAEDEALRLFDSPVILSQPSSVRPPAPPRALPAPPRPRAPLAAQDLRLGCRLGQGHEHLHGGGRLPLAPRLLEADAA